MSKAKGGVVSFAELAGEVGKNSSVDGDAVTKPMPAVSVPVVDLVSNPYNPRDAIGDLSDLASIVDEQLQPVVGVTRSAFVSLYPDAQVAGKWVVILGNRRLAAAVKYGRPELDIVVKDHLVKDGATLLTAIISENVDRKGFDVIEEAKAVEQLVQECGTAALAKGRLKKSDTWISQRRKLLSLDPRLQNALRAGDLAIRDARELAKVPPQEQVAIWLSRNGTAEHSGGGATGQAAPTTPRARSLSRPLRRFDAEPNALVSALHEELGDDRLKVLVNLLRKRIRQ